MNLALLEWISANRPAWLDGFFLGVTNLGSEFIPIILLAVVFWCLDRRYSTKVLLMIMLSLITNQLLKLVFVIKRPWLLSERVIPVEAALPDATGYSFPSGHTANATACAGSISVLHIPRWAKIISWIAVFFVAASRLYLCVHTPADVIVGFAASLIAVIAVNRFAAYIDANPGSVKIISVCVIIMVAGVIALAYIRPEDGTASRSDVLKLSGACAGAILSWCLLPRFSSYKPAMNIRSALLRVIPGIILLLAILEGSKPMFTKLFGYNIGSCVRYCVTTLTALTVWPYIFCKAGF